MVRGVYYLVFNSEKWKDSNIFYILEKYFIFGFKKKNIFVFLWYEKCKCSWISKLIFWNN